MLTPQEKGAEGDFGTRSTLVESGQESGFSMPPNDESMQLQAAANGSSQVRGLLQLQAAVNGSPRMQALQRNRAPASAQASGPIQRKIGEGEDGSYVIETKTNKVYQAFWDEKKKKYELFHLSTNGVILNRYKWVDADDDAFEVVDEGEASSLLAEQADLGAMSKVKSFGIPIDKDTSYVHSKDNNRVFLDKAPKETLDQFGESGRLIKDGLLGGTGDSGEQPDLRYIDFVNVINGIFEGLKKNPKDKSPALRAIKILNEFLFVIHDFKYRVRYEKSETQTKEEAQSRKVELEKCKQEIAVLQDLMDRIAKESDGEKLKALLQRAWEFFNITYGHGVIDSQLPGDMFGGSLDVNHANIDSIYGPPNIYKSVFKKTEEVRMKTNQDHEGTDFDEEYMAQSLFNTTESNVLEFEKEKEVESSDQIDFLKSRGIGRSNSKKLLSLLEEFDEDGMVELEKEEANDSLDQLTSEEEEEDFNDEFSDYFEETDTEEASAMERFVPNPKDSISEFGEKLDPFLMANAMHAKQMNEIALLRQAQRNKHGGGDSRLLGTLKKRRAKEKVEMDFISSGNRKEIAQKALRQIANIDEMLAAAKEFKENGEAHRYKKQTSKQIRAGKKPEVKKTMKSVEAIIAAWARTDLGRHEVIKRLKNKGKVSLDELVSALQTLRLYYRQVRFEHFERGNSSGGSYSYHSRDKFSFFDKVMAEKESPKAEPLKQPGKRLAKDPPEDHRPQTKKKKGLKTSSSGSSKKKKPSGNSGKKKSAGKSGGVPPAVRLAAYLNRGVASYGSSRGFNCLIYAIQAGAGIKLTDEEVRQVRRDIASAHPFFVDLDNFIAATPGVLNTIVQSIGRIKRSPLNITVLVTSTDNSINVVGNGSSGGAVVGVIHHVNHYWAFHPRR